MNVRVFELRSAIADMVGRYGTACQRCGSAKNAVEFERWDRAADRRFRAMQRLTAALAKEATR